MYLKSPEWMVILGIESSYDMSRRDSKFWNQDWRLSQVLWPDDQNIMQRSSKHWEGKAAQDCKQTPRIQATVKTLLVKVQLSKCAHLIYPADRPSGEQRQQPDRSQKLRAAAHWELSSQQQKWQGWTVDPAGHQLPQVARMLRGQNCEEFMRKNYFYILYVNTDVPHPTFVRVHQPSWLFHLHDRESSSNWAPLWSKSWRKPSPRQSSSSTVSLVFYNCNRMVQHDLWNVIEDQDYLVSRGKSASISSTLSSVTRVMVVRRGHRLASISKWPESGESP